MESIVCVGFYKHFVCRRLERSLIEVAVGGRWHSCIFAYIHERVRGVEDL